MVQAIISKPQHNPILKQKRGGQMAIGGVAMIQDVLLDLVESDNPTRNYDVTSKAVEDGADISDHMKERPATLSISGYLLNPDAWARMARIHKYQQTRQLITYTNRVIHSNMAITSINTRHSSTEANGLYFTIQLKHVRRAKPAMAQITNVPKATATKTAPRQNSGTQQARQTPKQANNKASDIRLASKAGMFFGAKVGGLVGG